MAIANLLGLALLFYTPFTIVSSLWLLIPLASLPIWVVFIAYSRMQHQIAVYMIDADAGQLYIRWPTAKISIPLSTIHTCEPAASRFQRVRNFRGVRWPGQFSGTGQLVAADRAASQSGIFYATGGLEKQLLIFTDTHTYGISPENPNAFREQLNNSRKGLSHTQIATPEPNSSSADSLIIGWLLAAAVGLNIALWIFLSLRLSQLPLILANPAGITANMASTADLIRLPAIGYLLWWINSAVTALAYRHTPSPKTSYLVATIGLLAQLAYTIIAFSELAGAR